MEHYPLRIMIYKFGNDCTDREIEHQWHQTASTHPILEPLHCQNFKRIGLLNLNKNKQTKTHKTHYFKINIHLFFTGYSMQTIQKRSDQQKINNTNQKREIFIRKETSLSVNIYANFNI